MTEHKMDINITEKQNSTSTVEYKTDVNMTETEQHFYDGTLNRTQLH